MMATIISLASSFGAKALPILRSILLNQWGRLVGAVLAISIWCWWTTGAKIDAAVERAITIAEQEAKTAALQEAERRDKIFSQISTDLTERIEAAEAQALEAEKELKNYAINTIQNRECVVDSSILERLRFR